MYSEDLTSRSIFATFEDKSGYQTFKAAVDAVPDVLGYLHRLNSHSPVTPGSSFRRQRESPSRSFLSSSNKKYSFGTHARFTIRPETAPGDSGLAVKHRGSSSPACRFQFRHETMTPMTPGPQSYQVVTPTKPLLGTISREPKFKERKSEDVQSVGPGAYDLDSSSRGHRGFRFGKELTDDLPTVEPLPGPGHYQPTEKVTSAGYSMGKALAMPMANVGQRLGPGCYNTSPSKVESPACRFSSAPRFPSSSQFDYIPRHRKLTKDEKEAQKRRIAANKDLESYKESNRKELLAKRGTINSTKMEVTKIAKSTLMESIKHRRQLALEDKFRRFEWRRNRTEVMEVGKSWISALLVLDVMVSIRHKYEHRKELHIRSRYALLFLTVTSLSIGVILRRLKRIRTRRSLEVISRLLVPVAKQWVSSRSSQYKALIVSLVEKAITQDIIFQLMVRWLAQLRRAQTAIRRFLARRRLMYIQAKMGWAIAEVSLKKNSKSRTFATDVFEKPSIPDKVKEHYIRAYIQKKSLVFFNELAKYRRFCEKVSQQYEARRCERQAEQVMRGEVRETDEEVSLPAPPVLFLGLTKDDFKAMIVEAEKNRLNWDKIANAGQVAEKRKSLKFDDRKRPK